MASHDRLRSRLLHLLFFSMNSSAIHSLIVIHQFSNFLWDLSSTFSNSFSILIWSQGNLTFYIFLSCHFPRNVNFFYDSHQLNEYKSAKQISLSINWIISNKVTAFFSWSNCNLYLLPYVKMFLWLMLVKCLVMLSSDRLQFTNPPANRTLFCLTLHSLAANPSFFC